MSDASTTSLISNTLNNALISLGQRPEREETWYAWFSEIGYCPLRAALRRAKVPAFYPLDEIEQGNLNMKLAVGEAVAGLIQSRVVEGNPGTFLAEYPVRDDELQVSGRIDLLYCEGDQPRAVIEFKTAAIRETPTYGNALQTLGYMMLTGAPDGFIVLLKPSGGYTLWSFAREGDGFILINGDGQNWTSAYNTPDILNFNTVKAEIAAHLKYLEFFRALSENEMEVIDYSLITPFGLGESDRAWMCAKTTEKPHRYARKYTTKDGVVYQAGEVRKGSAFGNCEYFCHGPNREIEIDLVPDENGADMYVYRVKETTHAQVQQEA